MPQAYGFGNETAQLNDWLARAAAGRENYYQPTPYINKNADAAQSLRNLFGNFFTPQINTLPARDPLQYQTAGYQMTPQVNLNPGAVKDAQDALILGAKIGAGYLGSQMVQNGLSRAGTGTTLGEAVSPALTYFAATKLAPLGKVGQAIGKYGGKLLDWLW